MKKYLPFLLLAMVLISACSSGKKALKRGDYYESVNRSIKRLRQSPRNDKARQILKEAYPRFLTYEQT
ncbi:MAG: hypothetical protein AAGI38_01965, partial [Bacteroidota bacterium]